MSVIAAYLYRDGRRIEEVPLDRPLHCAPGRSEFVWIGVLEPSEEELRTLQANFGLHPLAVEDALKAHQLPKVDVYGEQLFVVARTAHLEEDEIVYGETAIFVGSNQSQLKAIAVGVSPEEAWVRAMTMNTPKTTTWNPTMAYCTSLVA